MFSEDLDLFLVDHGLPCNAAGIDFLGILDTPDDGVSVGGKNMTSTMYALTVKTFDVKRCALKYNAAITVNGLPYTVREGQMLDDGSFTQLNLSKT